MIKRFASLLAIVTVICFSVGPVQAQDDSQSLSAELRRLKTQYRGELEEYRRLESQYQIAKEQYQQLQTLSSLEEGVNSTQAAMEARDRVLRTYLQILKVTLLQQTGIDIEQKEAALAALDSTIAQVDEHHTLFVEQMDKVDLQKISDEFAPLAEEVEQVSYRALSLVAVGELQSVYDKALLLRDDMQTKLATQGGALKQGQRQRAFQETERELTEIRTELQISREGLIDQQTTNNKSLYNNLKDELSETHTSLSQVVSFLKELVKI